MSLAAARSWIQSSSLWIYRVLTWAVLVTGFVFAGTILGLRYWILPDIGKYREDIAQRLSAAVQQKVTVGGLSGNWNGLRPQLALDQVVVHDAEGRAALELPRVEATLSWRSAALLQINFHALDIYRPMLTMRRDSRGGLTVAGIPLKLDVQSESEVSRWLLGQRDIQIHDARLLWSDELRAAPVLELDQVQSNRAQLIERVREQVKAMVDEWGVEVTRAEILDVALDEATRNAMLQQLNAERARRAQVTEAEGKKRAVELNADAELYAAEQESKARRILADAEAYATAVIAEAIKANGIEAAQYQVALKQVEALTAVGQGAGKQMIIVPAQALDAFGDAFKMLKGRL